MISLYKQTSDANIAPSTVSFNTLMNAWSKSTDPSAPEIAERIFDEMAQWPSDDVKPDVLTFSTLLDTYSRCVRPNAVERAEQIFSMMDDFGVQRNVYTYSALQNVYARSGRPDAPELCLKLLESMLHLYHSGNIFAKPNCVNYNTVLLACSRAKSKEAAQRAVDLLTKMERPDFDGGYDVEPDRFSYAVTILACVRCPDVVYAANMSEAILEKMEERARIEARKKEEISSAAPPAVTLDTESFNDVLTAISKSRQPDSVARTLAIIKRMEDYAKQGMDTIAPNTRSWNSVLHSLSRSRGRNIGEKAEQILNHMFEMHKNEKKNVKPDAFSFAAVLSAYQRMDTPSATQRADDIVRHMEELYAQGELDDHPDIVHYTILCASWARSRQNRAAPRIIEILSKLKEKHRAGVPNVKPNTRTYNTCLDALCRAGDTDKAEQLLYHMLALARDGDKDAQPDYFSFNCVISGFSRSTKRDAGRRAESILDRFLEYSEEVRHVRPDTRSFTHIIAHYARAKKMPDAPYRAEYVLNQLISLFRSGQKHLSPNVYAFTTVMDSYALHNHPDAGEYAERLLRNMRKLKYKYDADKVEVNTGVLNVVLHSWLCSGNEKAGYRVNALLEDMEMRADVEGQMELQPNARSYSLALTVWSKMKSSDKAEQAFRILKRTKERVEKGLLFVPRNDHLDCLVVNTCAFTSGDKHVEERAFQIAVEVMRTLIEETDFAHASITFGWFFQACGRLDVDKSLKEENIEWAFGKCCEMGLMNDFVLERFKGSASDELFERLVGHILPKPNNEENRRTKDTLQLDHLPTYWTRSSRDRVGKRTNVP
jgi:pentatricopeptide repeat protein